jgi:hypothetical protein
MTHGERGGLPVAAVLEKRRHLPVPIRHGPMIVDPGPTGIGHPTHSRGTARGQNHPFPAPGLPVTVGDPADAHRPDAGGR